MHLFDYSDITVSIPSDIVDDMTAIERIRSFDGIRIGRYAKELAKATDTLILADTLANCSAEGTSVEEDRLAALMSGIDPADADESVAKGFADALGEVLGNPASLDVDGKSLLHLHRLVTNGTTRRESRFRFRYTQDLDSAEHCRAVRTVPSEDVPAAVDQMAQSFAMARNVDVQALLLVPNMILDLVNIHPFPEMNWRITRLLCRTLLISGGFEALRYVPVDSMLLGDSEDYYESVAESSEGWRNNSNDPYPFVRFMVGKVLECYREFERRYPLADGRKLPKSKRIESYILSGRDPISKSELCSKLPDISRRTADKVIGDLVSDGTVAKTGTFKDARYTRP